MSAPPGRSATVTSLSGRVSALKFMQRASPSSTPTKPTSSTLPSTPATPASPSTSIPGSPSIGGEEEQWSLSPAAIARLRAKAQGQTHKKDGPAFQQEAGFDAWLINREKQGPEGEESRGASQRQTFGKLGKQKQEQEDDEQDSKKRSRGSKDDDGLEPDFEERDSEDDKPKGFIKPGSIGNRSRSDSANKVQASSPSSSKKARKDKSRGTKDQDKVVFARKRGGKQGISGGR